MATSIPQEWKDWIKTNQKRGCDVKEIFKILRINGFPVELIQKELKNTSLSDEEIILADQYILASSMERLHYWLRDDWLFLPFANKLESPHINAYTIDGFLNEDECDHVMAAMRSHLRPSRITRASPDEQFRTNASADLHLLGDPLISDIDLRMAYTLGIHPAYSEFMEGQRYAVGQQFKLHPDYFDDADYADHCIPQGQRTWTFMVYLNQPEKGGNTQFLEAELEVKPQKGMALIWNNLDSLGVRNRKAMHQACPVEKGYKAVLTKWFRQFPRSFVITKTPEEYIAPITRTGWKKTKMPAKLFQRLAGFYRENDKKHEPEIVSGDIIHGGEAHSSELITLSDTLKIAVLKELKPVLEKWSGISLQASAVYGIRRYLPGAILDMHRDWMETHVVSAVINIEQDVDQDWLLQIEDHHYRTHKIRLQPGQILMYEGARLLHGRPEPLKGRSFANLFAHYKPAEK